METPLRLTLIAVSALFVALAMLVAWTIVDCNRWRRRIRPVGQMPVWFWGSLMVAVAVATFATTPRNPGGRGPAPKPRVLPIAAVVVGWIVFFVGWEARRLYDPDIYRANERAKAGDLDGAIEDLRAAMEGRRSSAGRSHALGALLAVRGDWPGAYKQFLEAERIDGRKVDHVGNQGVMLWKMGRPEEAVPLLEEVLSVRPEEILHACNLGLVLVDLGRHDEARERLAMAERNLRGLKAHPASARLPLADQVEDLRKKIAGHPEARDRAVFDEA